MANAKKTTPAALSFSNPVYELSNPSAGESVIEGLNNLPEMPSTPQEPPTTPTTVAYKVEHVLTPGNCTPGKLSDLKNGFASRWRVAQSIYPYMVCIALAYCVTLSLYPGIESEIISCSLGTWMPVLLMFTFNTADLIGKTLAGVPYPWSRRQLILMSGLRIVLVPLLLLCCAPRHQPVISGETSAFFFTIALGISNGLAGSLPMMLAPAKVPATLKEVTGNMMTLSYNVGLTVGSFIGYVFESMLGAQLTSPCPKYPYIADPTRYHSTTTSTMLAPTAAEILSNSTAFAILTSTLSPLAASTTDASAATFSTYMLNTTAIATSTASSMAIGSISSTTTMTPAASTATMATLTTLAATVATIPDILTTIVNNVVTSINDFSSEFMGGGGTGGGGGGVADGGVATTTSDPQTPLELIRNI